MAYVIASGDAFDFDFFLYYFIDSSVTCRLAFSLNNLIRSHIDEIFSVWFFIVRNNCNICKWMLNGIGCFIDHTLRNFLKFIVNY